LRRVTWKELTKDEIPHSRDVVMMIEIYDGHVRILLDDIAVPAIMYKVEMGMNTEQWSKASLE
jgi:hypothetical protein